jgi:hypothetical protein
MMKKDIALKSLKDQILEILADDGMSITSIIKELENKGNKIHRLVLTGYLYALQDMNILREKDIKPSKVFSVASIKEKSIYDIIGTYVAEHPESSDVALYILYKLFKRPILKYELDKCDVGRPSYAEKIFGDGRKETLEIFEKLNISIPKNMPAYIPKKDYDPEFMDILAMIIIQKYSLYPYFSNKTTQLKIDTI